MPESADEIVWGVRRKLGYSEIDDPSAHRGLIQHAFVAGRYEVALCGTRTYGWRKPKHIRLAVPTEDNPSCRKCSLAIAFEVAEMVSVDRLKEMTTPIARKVVARKVREAKKALAAAEPIQIEAVRQERAERRMHAWPVKDFSQAA
jgi:hypothetical protein